MYYTLWNLVCNDGFSMLVVVKYMLCQFIGLVNIALHTPLYCGYNFTQFLPLFFIYNLLAFISVHITYFRHSISYIVCLINGGVFSLITLSFILYGIKMVVSVAELVINFVAVDYMNTRTPIL